MRRIAAIASALAFIVTAALLLLALALTVTTVVGPGTVRQALPELTLLAICMVAFLLAALPYIQADAEAVNSPVEVRLTDPQVDLMARVFDSLAERVELIHNGKPRPIPQGLAGGINVEAGRGPDGLPRLRETTLPRPRGGKHKARQ